MSLQSIISPYDKNGTFQLCAADNISDSINNLLKGCFEGGTITFTGAKAMPSPTVGYSGKLLPSSCLLLKDIQDLSTNEIEVSFSIYQATAVPIAAKIEIKLPPEQDYTLLMSFPVLDNSPFQYVVFNGVTLILTSTAETTNVGKLNLTGNIQDKEIFDLFYWVLHETSSADLNISLISRDEKLYPIISPADFVPLIDIGKNTNIFDFLPFELALSLQFGTDTVPTNSFQTNLSVLTVFETGTTMYLPVQMPLYGPGGLITLSLDTANPKFKIGDPFTALSSFFGGDSPKGVFNNLPLPPGIDSFQTIISEDVHLTKLSTTISPATRSIVSMQAGLDFKSSSGWKIINGFVLEDIGVLFTIPNVKSTKNFLTMLHANMTIGSGTSQANLSAWVSIPDLSFGISMISVYSITLKDFLKAFGGKAKNPTASSSTPDTFGITSISLTGSFNKANQFFKLSAEASGKLQIVDKLILDNIKFAIGYEKTKKPTPFSLMFYGAFSIGEIPLFVFASEENGEWSFSGGLKGGITGQNIADTFGITNLPSWLKSLDITDFKLSYNTGSKEFTLDFAASIELEGAEVGLSFVFNYNHSKKVFDIGGTVDIGKDLSLNLHLDKNYEGDSFTASLSDSKKISITDVAQAFGASFEMPKKLTDALSLSGFSFDYTFANKANKIPAKVSFEATNDGYGKFMIVGIQIPSNPPSQPKAKWLFVFGVKFTQKIDFSKLPVVGHFIKDHGGLSVTPVVFVDIPQVIPQNQAAELQLPADFPPLPPLGSKGIPKGPIIKCTITIDGTPHTFTLGYKGSNAEQKALPQKAGKTKTRALPTPPEPSAPTTPTATNQKVGKSFGPVTIQKFSAGYTNKRLDFNVSGSLSLGGIGLAVEGLSIGIPFPFDSDANFEFKLHGLGVDVHEGPLLIEGGFLDVGKGKEHSYIGAVNIQAGEFGLQAFGGYAHESYGTSFFIFVNAEFPIGGPPFFFLDGVAGGLGINRAFKLPTTFKELANYPLLPGTPAIPTSISPTQGGLQKLEKALVNLSRYIYPEKGSYWAAAGLDVSSFEMIHVDAVLSVAFGVNLEIALLASANMTLPVSEDPDPLAYIAINFLIALEPEKGIFTAMGMLTPASYIYSGLVHISGGFAFDIWFKGANEGNFVVSIGGYNPRFDKPSYYPSVPRLKITWGLGPFSLEGDAYFALTPRMMMAGLGVVAKWHGGPVKVTFGAGVDFMIGWKPFFYEADAYIHITGSVHILFTVNIHIGANLSVWGPSFGGKAHVHLSIISFTIHFGSDHATPPPLTWPEFKKLLPNSYPKAQKGQWALSGIQLSAGLIKQHAAAPILLSTNTLENIIQKLRTDKNHSAKVLNPTDIQTLGSNQHYNWILDPNHFRLKIKSNAPLTAFTFNTDQYAFKSGIHDFIDASQIPYITNPVGFYAKPPSAPAPSWYVSRPKLAGKLALVYDAPEQEKNPWWIAHGNTDKWWSAANEIGIGPMDIDQGNLSSSLSLQLSKITDDGKTLTLIEENFVVHLGTTAATGALWMGGGSKIENLKDAPTIPHSLTSLQIMPPIWSPEQTKSINIFELILQQNPLAASLAEAPPSVNPAFSKHDDKYEELDTLTVNEQAFFALATSVEPSGVLGSIMGGNHDFPYLTISVNASNLATITYQDLPILTTLGDNTNNLLS